ncbi:MAG: hypothetical protein RBT75_11105 [Anaerolineae bacterium]|jgi:hypothetical protein|nr:hypothetical protein [Anaerolineae bacterium]
MSTSLCNKGERERSLAFTRARRIALLCLLALLVLSLRAGDSALAQTSATYNLEWHVIAGGGQPVSSASYRVNATVGQGAASPPLATSATYRLSAGYWFRGIVPWRLYLPLVMRS